MNKQALIEAGKELLRVAVLAAIPVISASFNTQTGEVSIDWRVVTAVVVVAVLKALDKYVHKSDIPVKGVLPF